MVKEFVKQYFIDDIEEVDTIMFLNMMRNKVVNSLATNCMIKFNLVLHCMMEHIDMKTKEVIDLVFPFQSKTEIVLEVTNICELYSKAVDKILWSLAVFQMWGSGWRFKAVKRLEINSITLSIKG